MQELSSVKCTRGSPTPRKSDCSTEVNMLKRIFTATRITSAILVVSSVFIPVPIAEASGTITKTVTVLGADGNPVEGASVTIFSEQLTGSPTRTNAAPVATTNASGVATLTFADTAEWGVIYVEPSATDLLNASYSNYGINYSTNEPVTINLQKSSVRVNLLTYNNQPGPLYSVISYGSRLWVSTIRTGNINLNFPNTVATNTCDDLSIYAGDDGVGSFHRTFASKVTGSGETRTVTIYNDPTSCAVEAPKVNGVYQLQFNAGNISGNLLSNSGGPLSFSSTEGYEVWMAAVNSDGSRLDNGQSAFSYVKSDGSWDSYVDTSTVGKYELSFVSFGNPNLPTFTKKYYWVTNDHKLSWNADGSGATNALSGNFNLPISNLKLSFIDTSTGLNYRSQVDIQRKIEGSSNYMFINNWTFLDGKPSLYLSDGEYQITAWILGQNSQITSNFTITSGVATFISSSVTTKSYTNGTFNFWLPPHNFHAIMTDQSGNPVQGRFDFCGQNSCTNVSAKSNGTASGFVPDGTYSTIWVNPGLAANQGAMTLAGSVTNGVVSITGRTPTNGSYAIQLPTANIKFEVTHPTTGLPISAGWIGLETADTSWNPTGWAGNADIDGRNPGYARAYLADGKYLATVNVQSFDPTNAGLAGRTYQITVSGGVPSVSLNGTSVTATNGKFPVSPASSNLDLTVQNLSGTAINDGWVDFCIDQGGGVTGSCRGYGFNGSGEVSQYLSNGNWILVVRPGSSTGMSSKNYSVSVSGGVATVSGASKINGRWILTGSAPNITGSFTLASGTLTFGNNQGISLSVQKYNNGNWEWQNGGSWVSSSNYVLNVTAAGRYRVVANPNNFPDLVQSYSNEFWVNGSSKISKTENGVYTDTITALNILLKAPNLKMKIINPIDNSLLPGGWVSVMKINGQSRNWISNADISFSNPGLTGSNLTEVGEYSLTVNPPRGGNAIVGLAAREYRLTVDANDSMTVTLDGTPVSIDNGRYVLAPAAANITARIVKSDGSAFGNSNGKWVNVNLQKFYPEKNFWDYTSLNVNTDQDGYVSMRADSAGIYRLRIEPNGDADSTVTYSPEFTIENGGVSSFKKDFGNLTLSGPSIRISVATAANVTVALSYSGIEIRKDGNWIDWVNTNSNGVAGISLKSAGAYEFVINPPGNLQGTTARKAYKITATVNSDGVVSATADNVTGVSVTNGVTTLQLGVPTLTGTVLAPLPSSTVQANSQVYAQNVYSGQDMWEYSTSTNSSGAWAMSLPAGTYKIFARAPWGSSTYGGSDGIGNVVVDATGATTSVPAGLTASSFTIRLKAPTWSGVVKNPAGTGVVPNARICLRLNNVYTCVNADSNGAWALSAPTGFTSFTGTNPYLEVNDDFNRLYPQKKYDGVTDVNATLGTSGSNIILQFANANTQLTVTAAGSPVANVWVSAERDGVGWLGSGSTNANGLVKLDIANPTTDFKVRVDLNGNPTISSSYATTTKTFTNPQLVNGVFTDTVALDEPNFKVVLREPTSDGSVGSAVPYSWVELYSDTNGAWLGGANTDASGFASFKLTVPNTGLNNYTVTVNPPWNSTSLYSRQAYAVAVSPTATTVVNKTTTNTVTLQTVASRSVYPLTLSNPSVTGVVVDPTGATVANSWVVPRDAVTSEYFWQQGVISRNNGSIGLSLPSGAYTIEANVPWGSSGLSKSAACAVTVANGTISTGGSCVQDGAPKTVRLALRPPNVTFTLKINGAVVPNANVGIGAGRWYTNAQSDAQGVVSLNVDAPAIRAMNNSNSSQPLSVWVDPPYGANVEMARWDCRSGQQKPICSGLVDVPSTGEYPDSFLGDVTGVSPNTRIHIVDPATSANLSNSWVAVIAFDPASPNNRRWLGGGNTNSSGYVSINLDTSTVLSTWRFAVEINAPWNQRQMYATNYDNNSGTGFTWAQLINLPNKSPKAPNLKLTIQTSNSIANKYGGIGIEEVNSSDVTINWVSGYGLNEEGKFGLFLAASKRYRITVSPGAGKSGASTSCIVTTDSSEVVSLVAGKCAVGATLSSTVLSFKLAGGNVVGIVKRASGNQDPVAKAIVYANVPNAVDESTAVITSTDDDGMYGLQLDPTKTWNIKVFPTGTISSAIGIGSKTGVTPPSTGYASQPDILIADR